MKKKSRLQKSGRKQTPGDVCEEKKLSGNRGRPRKTVTMNCTVNTRQDVKATDDMQKPTEVKFRSSGKILPLLAAVCFLCFLKIHVYTRTCFEKRRYFIICLRSDHPSHSKQELIVLQIFHLMKLFSILYSDCALERHPKWHEHTRFLLTV